MRTRTAGAGLLLDVMAAACGASTPSPVTPPPAAPEGLAPDHPLVVAEELGGPTTIMDTFDPRSVSLYADGTLVAPGPRGSPLATVGTTLDNGALDEAWALVLGSGLAVDAASAVAGVVRTLPPDTAVEQAGARYSVGVHPIYPDEVDAVACP
jgi:hypothetical protein